MKILKLKVTMEYIFKQTNFFTGLFLPTALACFKFHKHSRKEICQMYANEQRITAF